MSASDQIDLAALRRAAEGHRLPRGIVVSPDFRRRLLAEAQIRHLDPVGESEWKYRGLAFRVVDHLPVDWAWDEPVPCSVCGRAVEDTRRFNAVPICHGCEPVRTAAEDAPW